MLHIEEKKRGEEQKKMTTKDVENASILSKLRRREGERRLSLLLVGSLMFEFILTTIQ